MPFIVESYLTTDWDFSLWIYSQFLSVELWSNQTQEQFIEIARCDRDTFTSSFRRCSIL